MVRGLASVCLKVRGGRQRSRRPQGSSYGTFYRGSRYREDSPTVTTQWLDGVSPPVLNTHGTLTEVWRGLTLLPKDIGNAEEFVPLVSSFSETGEGNTGGPDGVTESSGKSSGGLLATVSVRKKAFPGDSVRGRGDQPRQQNYLAHEKGMENSERQ